MLITDSVANALYVAANTSKNEMAQRLIFCIPAFVACVDALDQIERHCAANNISLMDGWTDLLIDARNALSDFRPRED